MATILVTGASGFVGSHVVPALIDDGHRVVALARDAESAALIAQRLNPAQRHALEARIGDITMPATLPAAMAGIDAIVHLAAIPRDYDGGQSLRLVNTEGTRNVVHAARETGVRRFVHQGAMAVVDDPDLHYASSKAKAMAIVRESGLDWTILEPSLLFGPRDGFFNLIAGLVRMSPGVVPITGSGGARFQPLAIGDLTRVVVDVLADETTIGREYPLGGPRYWSYREIVAEVVAAMGKRRALVPMPVPLIRLVAGSAEFVRLPFPVATDQLRQLRFDNIGPLDTIRIEFGFEPRPMEGGLAHVRYGLADQEPGAPGAI
ncbi:MAG TPA: NAD(P)H-binding protein [Candidatus Limnocylindrales bacterium]